MQYLTTEARQANEIAAMLAGYAYHCKGCKAVILNGAQCMYCTANQLRKYLDEARKQQNKLNRGWKGMKMDEAWKKRREHYSKTTLTTGDTT